MDNPKTKPGVPMDRYFVCFGKGSRYYLGLHLAQAELYMGLAAIFRRLTIKLYETVVSVT
jgi:cytochrome P450